MADAPSHEQERTHLLKELGQLQQRVKHNPRLAAEAQAIHFRLRELRRVSQHTPLVMINLPEPKDAP